MAAWWSIGKLNGRIFKRLQEELRYAGAESTIRRLVGQLRPSLRDVYIPLFFEPGEAAQVDWGEAIIYLNGEKIKANLICMRLCHSAMPFVMAFPSQRREAFIEGHIRAFEFFGGVPKRLIYDNQGNLKIAFRAPKTDGVIVLYKERDTAGAATSYWLMNYAGSNVIVMSPAEVPDVLSAENGFVLVKKINTVAKPNIW
ncbi:transposase [Thermacetogenium phaeum DSM 12270]|jgi:hypothetical protein|uniref:Transposase n=2 Tax=Thermacetogenium phaeum TaxID=85874 RepID=K4LDF3_THEPS|nr:DDE-type integrase/transposase/recombinase [Thermacetogenium phaeum]AFV11026.1 transposase [Thermacetogenium phaeum DSM 12270]MDK2881611.1 hypothetical protein [Clostridia bacterium]MDN5376566.1 hypothetical protein [Thermacetogenium sp.]